jgi:hypothetical protein
MQSQLREVAGAGISSQPTGLMENRPMLQLCKELGFVATMVPGEGSTAQIRLKL